VWERGRTKNKVWKRENASNRKKDGEFFLKNKKKPDRKKNSKKEGEEEWERGRSEKNNMKRERKSLGWRRTLKNRRWERFRKSGREGELEGED
jgi:hypothetical protein